ncbi:nucleotidyltransferase substrate binding protein [Candidatus Dependentiae bacterium]|nr:nucleotidyltransferase substrate binding protein [Candidatus Dependentiae bacterium]
MEQLKLKHEQACKAVKTLEDILVRLEKSRSGDKNQEDFIVNRDATIQRFEYSVDTTWKYLKLFLFKFYGVEMNSPKTVFKEAYKNRIISDHEITCALDMVDARNMTSHAYDEETADRVVEQIPRFTILLNKLLALCSPDSKNKK